MRVLQSYVAGQWHTPSGGGVEVHDATTGEPVARVGSDGIDVAGALAHARAVGGPALRRLTFGQRAGILKALAGYLTDHKEALYGLSTAAGATRSDAWLDIEGGTGVLSVYSSKGRKELPDAHFLRDGDAEVLAKDGTFLGLHLLVPREGVAVLINAFNFPVWGMLEKVAPALLAGVPVLVKPATPTAYVAEAAVRLMVESGVLPEGAVQLVCGSLGDAFDNLTGQDSVFFTGSAATATKLRSHPQVLAQSVRFTAEADSLNASVLGPAAVPGTAEFDLYVKEVAREMTTKAGQRCTAIRRALVPAGLVDDVVAALADRLAKVVIGDPRREEVRMGPLVSLEQRDEVERALSTLAEGAEVAVGGPDGKFDPVGAEAGHGAFLAPTVLVARDASLPAPHDIEPFGPVCTVLPYGGVEEAIDLARLGKGSLVVSVFTPDAAEAGQLAQGLAPHHGRVLLVDERCGKSQTGHGSPMPQLVHGGPGRAGGGEELGGLRSVHHHLQRVAVQGSPDMLSALTGTFLPGATRVEGGAHPFTKHFEDLALGDTLVTASRTITVEDIERFADLTGDHFYAHTDEEAAAKSPIFGGRVAHGYFVIAAAAGLFVWPDPGPVLANYGIDRLRFTTPVRPGDAIHVVFTCKEKAPRRGAGYGEVRWDTQVVNQDGTVVAAYDVLTMVATREGAQQ
ncbi:MAG: oxepin-CoA hydrolase / 3-oxo-5,6-dehydrosuberyl-CoA semialdehyde dehydrogenase, partial [Actinomycetota bacterium]|nr:oxepin-CoA hydrolase / 3-oxo-5,6-dehydrosuberyl-CoA semialdehyde dehydrogenase [Actinomycetota bacterium]